METTGKYAISDLRICQASSLAGNLLHVYQYKYTYKGNPALGNLGFVAFAGKDLGESQDATLDP
jgi:hypothetical protein